MLISTEQYRAQCEAFFALADNTQDAIAQQLAGLDVHQFEAWRNAIIERYDDATCGLIRELVEQIDGNDESEKSLNQRHVVRTYRQINNAVCQENLFNLAIVQEKTAQRQAWTTEEDRKRALRVSVDGKDFTAENVIDVLWCGWECDAQAWLVRDEGVARLVTTDHGSARFSDKEFLEARIAAYQDAIAKTQAMLDGLAHDSNNDFNFFD